MDGWGSLTTPLGTFNALRIRHDISENDSIYQTFFGTGSWFAPPSFVTTEYEWWTTGKKECLVRATVGGFGQNQTPTIEYQDIYLGLDAGLSAPSFEISFSFDFSNLKILKPFDFLEIMDASGRVVLRHENAALQGYFDISTLPNGTYTVRIQAPTGVAVKKLVKL